MRTSMSRSSSSLSLQQEPLSLKRFKQSMIMMKPLQQSKSLNSNNTNSSLNINLKCLTIKEDDFDLVQSKIKLNKGELEHQFERFNSLIDIEQSYQTTIDK
ncbi:Hypothetical_protein [Hexamita inflata]|uniref:Hypothetical_protein n=1 Tax=Hexamita inflata TaxID=28002 RepID=A0AA86UHH4_9EUKA|nr:Hypothetical protein HINF_LOCUS39736 [Hexamita inflata]